MKKEDRLFTHHIRDELLLLEKVTENLTYSELLDNLILQHCIQKSLEIIGEASKKISDEQKANCPKIPWKQIAGMRDKLSHGYFDINWEIVWDVLHNDVPYLTLCIQKLLSQNSEDNSAE